MSTPLICLLIIAIGFVAGLRSMTAPAAVSWGAHLGWLALKGSALGFLSSPVAVGIFTLAALGELVADQLPTTPNRTAPFPFGARIVMGGFCGAAIALAAEQPWLVGVGLGVIGAVMGTFGGYYARKGATEAHVAPAFVIATVEDLIAIGAALLIVSRF
jgi:uncharacterized membrane protein